jgi:hypothetical protein
VSQSIIVLEHDSGELSPLVLIQFPRLQHLQVHSDQRDRCLQLVHEGIDERVVLLVAPDFRKRKMF